MKYILIGSMRGIGLGLICSALGFDAPHMVAFMIGSALVLATLGETTAI